MGETLITLPNKGGNVMAQNTANTVAVEHSGEKHDIPTTFRRSDLAAWFGSVPDEFDVDRIFTFEGALRVESYWGNGEWVEAVLHTDEWHETFNAHNDRGWVADTISGDPREEYEDPGETLWERDN